MVPAVASDPMRHSKAGSMQAGGRVGRSFSRDQQRARLPPLSPTQGAWLCLHSCLSFDLEWVCPLVPLTWFAKSLDSYAGLSSSFYYYYFLVCCFNSVSVDR